MKRLKMLISILMIILFYQTCYSYNVIVYYPNPCEAFPTHKPNNALNFNVGFRINRTDYHQTEIALVKIFAQQRGTSHLIFQDYLGTGMDLDRAVNLSSFPNFCYNEQLKITVEAYSLGIMNLPSYGYGFMIIHRHSLSCENASLSPYSINLMESNSIWGFSRSSSCNYLSFGIYFVDRYRVRFRLPGVFTDSIPKIIPEQCYGFEPSNPNYQNYWGGLVSLSSNEAIFETYVYKNVRDFAGNFIGDFPCIPEEARITYTFCRRPVIDSLVQYPRPITPSRREGIVTCHARRTVGDLNYQWSDTNGFPGIEFTPTNNYARIRRNIWSDIDNLSAGYSVLCTLRTGCFSPAAGLIEIVWGGDSHLCPNLVFTIDNFKITENNILNLSPSMPGRIITDNYRINNPLLEDKDRIEFEIVETGDEQTELDLLELYQIKTDIGNNFSITENGTEVCYQESSSKGKIVWNNLLDVSDELSFRDDKIKKLEQGDSLVMESLPGSGNIISIITWGPTLKEESAGIIKTSGGSEFEFLSRNSESHLCIETNEKHVSKFTLIAKQKFVIDQIAVVKNSGNFVKEKLFLKSALKNSGDIRNEISRQDGIFTKIVRDDKVNFIFGNNPDKDRKSFYYLKIAGAYKNLDSSGRNSSKNNEPGLRYILSDNLPNPFNPETKIYFEIPVREFVKISIYDITGREIKTLVNEFRDKGSYDVTFDGSELTSGIYFYRMNAGKFSQTKRMILIK